MEYSMVKDRLQSDIQNLEQLQKARHEILTQLNNVIVGQQTVIDNLLIALFAQGHCLLVGVPGLAKTLLISSLAKILDLKFSRVQFTPDLMPSDITGTEILEEDHTTGKKMFKFIKGPVFANILLADEINRTPPKTQAALLQAMQEFEVTAAGQSYKLDAPFFVLATQNPIEQEGTYPLPEAQLDRFMFNLWIDYPSEVEEQTIVKTTTSSRIPDLKTVITSNDIIRFQELVRSVPVSDIVVNYAVSLARKTRPGNEDAPQYVQDWVSWGAGPRAAQYLILGAKSKCVLEGRATPDIADVKSVALPVLRHRVVTNFHAEADGIQSTQVIEKLLEETNG